MISANKRDGTLALAAAGSFSWMKIETLAANIKTAVLWRQRNSAAVRAFFVFAAAVRPVHQTNLTSRYPVF
jgi:hypothetical protein